MKSVLSAAFLLATSVSAFAVECPPGMPSCKVLFISPQEEQALIQQSGILATAAQGRPLDLGQAVQYFMAKIKDAPAGEVKKPEKPDASGNPALPPKPLKK